MALRDVNPVGVLLAVVLIPPVLLWLSATGNPLWYFDGDVPPGQLLYVLSKLGGLVALTLFGVQLFLMVLRVLGVRAVIRVRSVRFHRVLGATVVLAVLVHVGLFTSAASLRSGHFAWHPLVLNWSSGFYDQMVSIGVIALVVLLGLAVLGRRVSRGRECTRFLHRLLALLCAPLVLVHSFTIGSETGTLGMTLFYIILSVAYVVGAALLVRSRHRRIERVHG